MFSSGEEHRRSAQQSRKKLEKQATSIEVSPPYLLKDAANVWGHVLEDTADRIPPQSCRDVIWRAWGISPLIFVEKNFFEKVI